MYTKNPPELPEIPQDAFRCAKYSCILKGSACVRRQLAKEFLPNGRAFQVATDRYRNHCTSGDCEQGKKIKAHLWEPQRVPPHKP